MLKRPAANNETKSLQKRGPSLVKAPPPQNRRAATAGLALLLLPAAISIIVGAYVGNEGLISFRVLAMAGRTSLPVNAVWTAKTVATRGLLMADCRLRRLVHSCLYRAQLGRLAGTARGTGGFLLAAALHFAQQTDASNAAALHILRTQQE